MEISSLVISLEGFTESYVRQFFTESSAGEIYIIKHDTITKCGGFSTCTLI